MAQPLRVWQRMLSGKRLDLIAPDPSDVTIEDIAHGLSRIARWNGQTTGEFPFSVAQHSLLVWRIFCYQQEIPLGPSHKPEPTESKQGDQMMMALLHDAAEFVIGDLIAPFKQVVGGGYADIEDRVMTAVCQSFQLPEACRDETKHRIKAADKVAASLEAVALAGFSPQEAEQFIGVLPALPFDVGPWIEPQATGVVCSQFLETFRLLQRYRDQ